MCSVPLASVAPQAWRNGGGRTRELLCWPAPENWALRISVADIDTDGPFSCFAGIERWFAVIEGAGVALSFPEVEYQLVPGDAPLCFAGAPAPGCRLINGATRDLNLMTKLGQSTMRQAQSGVEWSEPFAMRGLYAAVDGHWSCGNEKGDVLANTLLWSDTKTSTAWRFESATTNALACGWWLGFTPQ
jgi:uncharacterized protein